ncbi:Copper Transporter integral membrane protein that functions in high affinity copper transport [Orbilia oligospora]|uniref:Copper transport protein n=1 Tax=Orbilia oligospora TaxID=2813651 RepID=A0A7C8PS75_ORBOL|nr:Copper Transporter integral membrane protein that functions in high affinity copper transport [Orbilia oligospora]TGJ67135.1 Copper Transporter integral membrane protein that functions in high affinity copper transport [Orbilia oligospora]
MDHHVKHAAHEGHDHSHMDHTNMNHTAEETGEMDHSHHHHHNHHHTPEANNTSSTTMDHSTMDHSSHNHAGHDHAPMMHGAAAGPMCKMDMYWNWYTIDACFLSKSWHITSAGMFAGSCIGIVFLVVLVEALRRCVREWDRYIVRDWKKRAITAADGVNVTIPDTDTKDITTGCCSSTPAEIASSSSSQKGGLVTKPSAISTTTKKSFLSRLCPFTPSTKSSVATPRPTIVQHLLKSLIYAVLLGVGYILMLLAMYYNGYIFFCLVIGAWLGNFLFGMDTCVLDESVVGAERGCGC